MSTLYVDTITEKTSGNGVQIPGHVVQVVSAIKTDTFSMGTSTITDIPDLSVTLTPASTSSKLLITGSVALARVYDACANLFISVNGTTVGNADTAGLRTSAHAGIAYSYYSNANGGTATYYEVSNAPIHYLYSPNSTSAQTVKIRLNNSDTTASTIYVNRSWSDNNDVWEARYTSNLTVMEIAQ
jgi:hypothetical protein